MAEDTADQQPNPKETGFAGRVLSKFREKLGNREEDAAPQWYNKAIEGMTGKDKKAINKLRKLFKRQGTQQKWYYSGSGADISPTLIAPPDTEHWMVDVGYDSSNYFFRPEFSEKLTKPYQNVGASVEVAEPWNEAWEKKRQTITVDGATRLQLVGGRTQDKETAPDSIDVIYTNTISTKPGPDALIALKPGGLYVFASTRDTPQLTDLELIDTSWKALGLSLTDTINVASLHFPSFGEDKVAGGADGKTFWYQIYEKTRAFTPEEEDILQVNSSLVDINYQLHSLLYNFVRDETKGHVLDEQEASLSEAFRTFYSKLQHLKGKSEDLANNSQSYLDKLFPEGEAMPELYREQPNYNKANDNSVAAHYTRASEIYQTIKAQSGQAQ